MSYKPGYIEGKRKKAFYLDEALARELAYRSIDTGESQSEIVERALKRELDLIKNTKLPVGAGLIVVSRAEAEVDWSIGYLDGMPAVGDWSSNWYIVNKDTAVLNSFEGAVWHLQNGQWQRVGRAMWKHPITPTAKLIESESDYIETDDHS